MEDAYSINTGEIRKFGPVDYVMFVLCLVLSAAIGLLYAIRDRRRNTTRQFLLAGKTMGVLPVAMSLMVTFQAPPTFLGNPAEMYRYNTMFMWVVLAMFLGVIAATHIFMPFFYHLQLTSTFEYLEMRFSKPAKIVASCCLLLQSVLYIAIILYSPSLALNAVTGVDLWGCVVGIGAVVTFYTTLGGMKAVLWTDTFQAGVIFAGLLAVFIQGCILEGGFPRAWEIADNRSRIVLDDFSVDPRTRHSVWTVVVGGTWFWLYLFGFHQAQIQRCLSCPTVKKAQLAMLVNLPGLLLMNILCFLIGILMFAFYSDCHPISFGVISKLDQLVPLYTMDILGHLDGIAGVFVSCVVSGSLSSISSTLNAVSAIVLRDFLQGQGWCQNISESRSAVISRTIVVVTGVLGVLCAWIISKLGAILQVVYSVFGILNGPVLGAFTLGMLFPWANKWGAVVGVWASLIFSGWLGLGAFFTNVRAPPPSFTVTSGCGNSTARLTSSPLTAATTLATIANMTTAATESSAGVLEPLYRMSYMWYTGLGMVVVWVVGMAVSLCTGPTKPKSLDPRLICPIFDKLFPYLPEKIRKPLRFGVVHKGKYDKDPDTTETPDGAYNDPADWKDVKIEMTHITRL